MELSDGAKKALATQGTAAAVGAAYGAVTKHVMTPRPGMRGGTAAQVASATAAAAAGGAGLGGSVAAGAGIVTAKVAVVTAAATAAAPVVLGAAVIGAAGYGIYRLWKRL